MCLQVEKAKINIFSVQSLSNQLHENIWTTHFHFSVSSKFGREWIAHNPTSAYTLGGYRIGKKPHAQIHSKGCFLGERGLVFHSWLSCRTWLLPEQTALVGFENETENGNDTARGSCSLLLLQSLSLRLECFWVRCMIFYSICFMIQPHKTWFLPWRMLAFSHSFHYSSNCTIWATGLSLCLLPKFSRNGMKFLELWLQLQII